MVKILFSVLTVWTLAAQTASAQTDSLKEPTYPHWAMQLSGGYGLPFAQQYLGYDEHYDSQNVVTYSALKGSIGSGVLNTLTVSYKIKERIGIELGAFANWGREIRVRHYSSEVFPDIYRDRYARVNTRGLLLGFSLSERFEKVEIGLHNYFMLSFYNRGYDREHRGDTNDEFNTVIENTGNVGMGWLNKLSVRYSITDHFSLGLEGFIVLQTWSPNQGEFIVKSYNGVDGASALPDEDRIFTYPETYSGPSNPYVYATAFTYNLNSCGAAFTLGFTF